MSCLVRNINGTSTRKPTGFRSWKEFWESKKKEPFTFCAREGCYNAAEVGAHVQRVRAGASKEWYIVPLCKECNNQKDISFKVDQNYLVKLV